MIKVPIEKHQDLIRAEEERHESATYELEKAKRIELAKFFGLKEADVLTPDRHGHWPSKWDIIDKHFKKLVYNEARELVFSSSRSGHCRSQDGEIELYHGTPPKKNRHHKGFSVSFSIYQAPNGLWVGESNRLTCPPEGHNFGSHRHYGFTEAFHSQDEVFAHCVNQVVHALTGPIEVDTDPQEIEVPCPTCEAWKKAHTKKDKNEDGEEYEYISPKFNRESLDADCECPTCQNEYPWGYGMDNNTISRMETPEETKARIAKESKDRGYPEQYQPQAEAFANQLLEMVGQKEGQQLSLF